MTTIIVDYSSGNLHSALKSFQRMAGETNAGPVAVSADPEAVRRADRIVLPGVGAFGDAMSELGRRGFVAPQLFSLSSDEQPS